MEIYLNSNILKIAGNFLLCKKFHVSLQSDKVNAVRLNMNSHSSSKAY